MQSSYCVREQKDCVVWIERYFKDCLCNLRDDLSFGFGIVSLLCWGLAEIPQIITNFRTKSSHGVSLLFLLTWVAGDAFNLVGCFLEPATLPTQLYTALLYTINTVVLVLQTLYYDYFYRMWTHRKAKSTQTAEEETTPLKQKVVGYSGIPIPTPSPKPAARREFYYTSARSLAASDTPPFRAFLRLPKSEPSTLVDDSSSSDNESDSVAAVSSNLTVGQSQPRPIPRSVGYGTFLAATANLPFQSKGFLFSDNNIMGFGGRKLLQEHGSHSAYGQLLGWLMAAIYMGGRLPQIWLNIKRGSVEGLNPLMFVFALVANATYVASILIRSMEWEKIKANMPWLLDAIVCVLLDLFIILQYIYYRRYRRKNHRTRHHDEEKWKNTTS